MLYDFVLFCRWILHPCGRQIEVHINFPHRTTGKFISLLHYEQMFLVELLFLFASNGPLDEGVPKNTNAVKDMKMATFAHNATLLDRTIHCFVLAWIQIWLMHFHLPYDV